MYAIDDYPEFVLKVVLIEGKGITPTRATLRAAGYDLYASEPEVVPPRGRQNIRTHISICEPPGHYGRILPRSGIALRNGIDVGAGVDDNDYTGEIGILLFNHTDTPFKVEIGDRVAQIVISPFAAPPIEICKSLPETTRGDKGFGSTGK